MLWIIASILLALVIAYVSWRIIGPKDAKPKSGGGKGEGEEGP